jgi:amino acid transporter
MLLQAVVTIIFVVGFGWSGSGGVQNIVVATAPYFWLFLTATVISLIVCRFRYRGQFAGYRVPLFPILPLVFVAACLFMSYRAYTYMWSKEGLWKSSLLIGLWVVGGFGLSFVLKSNKELSSKNE